MKIAVEGCAHGELDKIYESITILEKENNIRVDLLIICGDFQAVRNTTDLKCMAVPAKYKKLNTFYKYYSGEKTAPILTIFIGGNHEASNYLSELPYGGWVCPNIYYMGNAGVINIGGIRIAGLSGIYKGNDYLKGHFEIAPYSDSTVRSIYHIRNIDVFRLKQIKRPVDICFSHDWPQGVYNFGDMKGLLRKKSFFREEMESNKLGSPPAMELLETLRPSYWFAAHLHCKFSAIVPHSDNEHPFTRFLALDKCLPRRNFLQVVDIESKRDALGLEYDPEWMCILQNTDHLLSTSRQNVYMPGPREDTKLDFTASEKDVENIKRMFNEQLKIPNNFSITAPIYTGNHSFSHDTDVRIYNNPQTQRLSELLNLKIPFRPSSNSLSISDFNSSEKSYSHCSAENPEEIPISDDDAPSVYTTEDNTSGASDFFIDKTGSCHLSDSTQADLEEFFIDKNGSHNTFESDYVPGSSFVKDSDSSFMLNSDSRNDNSLSNVSTNKQMFLENQFCTTTAAHDHKSIEQFPGLKCDSYEEEKDFQPTKKFKRRNLSLYSSENAENN